MNATTFTLGVAAGAWLADDTRLPAHIRASFAQHPSVVAARTNQLRADIDEWERGGQ